jgi:hypothetical protein
MGLECIPRASKEGHSCDAGFGREDILGRLDTMESEPSDCVRACLKQQVWMEATIESVEQR